MSPSSGSEMPKMPKTDVETKAFFRSIVPEDPDITVRPMFGNLAAFVHGNMFTGLFGTDLFVRLSADDRAELERAGGGPFEPMPGRAMTGYTLLPEAWNSDAEQASAWIDRSLGFARGLPPKQPKPKKPRKA